MGRQPSSGISPSPSGDSPPTRWRSMETEGSRSSPRGERDRNGEAAEEGGRIKSNLYKTELCRSYEETGGCNYGAKCQFAHGAHELRSTNKHPRYKTEICKTFHTIGTCPYGKRCRFIHMEGIPQVWMPTNPLNYLILHEDRGPYELTPEISLDTFLKVLEATKTPDLAPEMAYIAKLLANNHQAPTQSDLMNIHQRVLSGYPKGHRLPIFAKTVSLV